MYRRPANLAVARTLLCLLAACSLETGGSAPADDSALGGEPPDDGSPDNEEEGVVDPGEAPPQTRDGGVTTPRSDASTPSNNSTVGPCKAGRYEGTYECVYEDTGLGFGGISSSTVTGPVTFELEEQDEDLFKFIDGKFAASAGSFQTISANINATLTCGKPFEGALVMGEVGALFGLNSSTFGSALRASYDGKTSTFLNGTWGIRMSTAGAAGCTGSWTARYVGP